MIVKYVIMSSCILLGSRLDVKHVLLKFKQPNRNLRGQMP